jgi:hypothetical protein
MTINTRVPHPDLRDERGRTNPGLWQRSPGGTPISRPFPAGGMIDPSVYHDKAPLSSPSPEGHPMPLKGK